MTVCGAASVIGGMGGKERASAPANIALRAFGGASPAASSETTAAPPPSSPRPGKSQPFKQLAEQEPAAEQPTPTPPTPVPPQAGAPSPRNVSFRDGGAAANEGAKLDRVLAAVEAVAAVVREQERAQGQMGERLERLDSKMAELLAAQSPA